MNLRSERAEHAPFVRLLAIAVAMLLLALWMWPASPASPAPVAPDAAAAIAPLKASEPDEFFSRTVIPVVTPAPKLSEEPESEPPEWTINPVHCDFVSSSPPTGEVIVFEHIPGYDGMPMHGTYNERLHIEGGTLTFSSGRRTGSGEVTAHGFGVFPIEWEEQPDGSVTCTPIMLVPAIEVTGTVSPPDAERIQVKGCGHGTYRLDSDGGFFYEGSANGEPCIIQATGWVDGVELFAFVGVGTPQPGDTVTADLVLEPLGAED